MKRLYPLSSFCAACALFLLSSINTNALSYWTQQYDGLPPLYDVTGIIGYGNNMILGGTPYYTPTSAVSFTASTGSHRVYRFLKVNSTVFGVGDSAILKSTDNGITWTPTNMNYPTYKISSDARLSYDGTTLYTWDPFYNDFGFAVMKSTDGGNTWLSTGIQKPDGYGFLVHNGVIYASALSSMQYSTTNGNTWLYITTIGSTINDIVVFNDSVFVASNTGVYKSSDNGQHWSGSMQGNTLCLCVAGTSLVCGTHAKGVWQSDPSGDHWFSKSDDLPYIGSDNKPVTSLSINDMYVMANVLYDTTTTGPITFHSLYTLPISGLSTANMEHAITDIQVYPNPAKDEIFISADQLKEQHVHISLLDMLGRVVLSQVNDHTPLISLKLRNIPQGTYIVNISTAQSSLSKKIDIIN